MTPTARRTLGVFVILMLILVISLVVMVFANHIIAWPIWAQTLFYVVAGLAWLLPLKPLLVWMNKGQSQ